MKGYRSSLFFQRLDWAAIALGLAVLAINLRTLAPSLLWSDEGEFQFQIAVLGVPHQTGYPLYVLLGKLWTWLVPVGTIAYRVNLLSAVFGAATAILVYMAIKRVTGQRAAALVGAATLAVSAAFWQQSSIAGVRTFHTAFVALITLLSIGTLQGWASLEALALAVGLSFAHHRMTLLLLPGLAWVTGQFLLAQAGQPARLALAGRLARASILVLLPQFFYLYVWLGQEWASLEHFLQFTLATNELPIVLAKSHAELTKQFVTQVFPSLWRAFTPPGLLIALLGLAALALPAREEKGWRHSLGLYLAVGIVINVVFAGIHFTEDPDKYLTHGLTLLAVALGVGVAELSTRLARGRRQVAWSLAALGMLLPLVSGVLSFRTADQSHLVWIDAFTLDRMTQIESGSLVVADWSNAWPMRYLQSVNGHRRDLTVWTTNDTTRQQAEAVLLSGGPVYIARPAEFQAWKSKYTLVKSPGGLTRVLPRPPDWGPTRALHEAFGENLVLTGIATWPARLTSNQLVLTRLYWQSLSWPEATMALSVRLIGADGHVWGQKDADVELAEFSETAFFLGPTVPVGDYHWQIVVDDPLDKQTLGLLDLPAFRIERPALPPAPDSVVVTVRPARPLQVGGWSLLGTNPSAAEIRPGAPLLVPLFWHKVNSEVPDASLRVQMLDRKGSVAAETKVPWPNAAETGDLVELRAVIQPPRDLADGDYTLRVVLADDWTSASIGNLRVQGRRHVYRLPAGIETRSVRLGERIQLAGYTLASPKVSPGESVQLTLYWLAVEKGTKNYKVFVHLVGEHGQLMSQQDGIPVRWSVPTDTWLKGEIIADSYELGIPSDAALGTYRLLAGMYDPDNGERLPAIENGQPLPNDVIALAGLEIE
ncbi:MAG: DUF2723 domain-containing protein [Thermoflexales bacterium]|nr:DUF2723 domain-containing protein [Thermoflexales bacterium]